MKSSELAQTLRDLADRVEQFNLPPDHNVTLELNFSTATTRDELAAYVAFAGNPIEVATSSGNSWLRRYPWTNSPFAICVHFTKGLLGGSQRVVVDDDGPEGLAALVAEYGTETPASETIATECETIGATAGTGAAT